MSHPGAQAWWQGGWWEARVVEHTAEGAYRLQSLPEPEGENEIWEAKADLVCTHLNIPPPHPLPHPQIPFHHCFSVEFLG